MINKTNMARYLLVLVLVVALVFGEEIDPEFKRITCGSSIKLINKQTGYRLHSHEIPYGTGSGQQSITGFARMDDTNSYFSVRGGFTSPVKECPRGTPINCNSIIRLQHLNTKKFLHSHMHVSPLSRQQEVSGYPAPGDSGDNWKVICLNNNGKALNDNSFWERGNPIRLQHVETSKYLTTSRNYAYQNPIPGQLEVSCIPNATPDTIWFSQEGIYMADITQ